MRVLALLMALVAMPALGQELPEIHARLVTALQALEGDLERYAAARERERAAIRDLQQANSRLDSALGDPAVSLALLRRLEAAAESAHADLNGAASESAEIRGRVYQRMATLAEVMAEVEQQGIEPVAAGAGLTGTWRVQALGEDIHGIISLRQEGTLLSGSYRMSTGARGSLWGTATGGGLELEIVDAERGVVGEMFGVLDAETYELTGQWRARELGSGGPSLVDWRARRVTLDDLLE